MLLAEPLEEEPPAGSPIVFLGTGDSFRKQPLLLTFRDGRLDAPSPF